MSGVIVLGDEAWAVNGVTIWPFLEACRQAVAEDARLSELFDIDAALASAGLDVSTKHPEEAQMMAQVMLDVAQDEVARGLAKRPGDERQHEGYLASLSGDLIPKLERFLKAT